MPNILLIETSQTTCSVALTCDKTEECAEWVVSEPMQHATQLPVMIQQAIERAKQGWMHIDAIAVSGGPGSYTGLRIGVSTAKGLAYATGVPLIAVDTLEVMAYEMRERIAQEENCLLCPMIDARRMEVYTALYDGTLNQVEGAEAKIITAEALDYISPEMTIYLGGGGSDKCRGVIASPRTVWIEGINPTAKAMAEIARRLYDEQRFADVAYYEPFYLKEFQATTPKNKI